MNVTEEQLQSFIALYKTEFGIELSAGEARYSAESLLYIVACSIKRPVEKVADNDMLNIPDLSKIDTSIFVPKNGQ